MRHVLSGFVILALSLLSLTGRAQYNAGDSTTRKPTTARLSRPDIPGDLMVEVGFNLLTEAPERLKTQLWGSKVVNLYYLFHFPIGKSKFSFHTGMGLGLEKYDFSKPVTLSLDSGGNTTIVNLKDTFGQASDFKKSKLAANYFDIPLEFRFSSLPDDPGRSFKAALGVKGGVLFSSHTKVKYKEDSEVKKLKNQQSFNLSRLRYGAYARIGLGNVSLFYNYTLSTLFESGKGPGKTDLQPMNAGISITGF